MFSQLGPLFKTTFRKTETNDARLAIPHEERDQYRRRQEEDREEVDTDPWKDNMSVTVSALRTFLVNFLQTIPGGQDVVKATTQNEEVTQYGRPRERKRPNNTRRAKAVRAYQSTATHVQRTGSDEAYRETKKNVKPTADLLQSQELRDIYEMIEALDDLENKNIQMLEINKADSFLEALRAAINQAYKRQKL